MAETDDKAPLMLPTTFTYAPETRTIAEGAMLEVGPSDLVFYRASTPATPGGKPPVPLMHTFVVLRRTNP